MNRGIAVIYWSQRDTTLIESPERNLRQLVEVSLA